MGVAVACTVVIAIFGPRVDTSATADLPLFSPPLPPPPVTTPAGTGGAGPGGGDQVAVQEKASEDGGGEGGAKALDASAGLEQDSQQQQQQQVEEEEELVEGASCISLACPLSHMRIKTPVKGKSCRHHQCFDFDAYLAVNERRPAWRCPCCNVHLARPDLRLDRKFLDVLEQVKGDPGVKRVLVKPSGEWEYTWGGLEGEDDDQSLAPFGSGPPPKRLRRGQGENATPGLSAGVEAAQEDGNVSNGGLAAGGARSAPAVIELDSEDEGDRQPGSARGGEGHAAGGERGQAGVPSPPGSATGVVQWSSAAAADVKPGQQELAAGAADRNPAPSYSALAAATVGGHPQAPQGLLVAPPCPLTVPAATPPPPPPPPAAAAAAVRTGIAAPSAQQGWPTAAAAPSSSTFSTHPPRPQEAPALRHARPGPHPATAAAAPSIRQQVATGAGGSAAPLGAPAPAGAGGNPQWQAQASSLVEAVLAGRAALTRGARAQRAQQQSTYAPFVAPPIALPGVHGSAAAAGQGNALGGTSGGLLQGNNSLRQQWHRLQQQQQRHQQQVEQLQQQQAAELQQQAVLLQQMHHQGAQQRQQQQQLQHAYVATTAIAEQALLFSNETQQQATTGGALIYSSGQQAQQQMQLQQYSQAGGVPAGALAGGHVPASAGVRRLLPPAVAPRSEAAQAPSSYRATTAAASSFNLGTSHNPATHGARVSSSSPQQPVHAPSRTTQYTGMHMVTTRGLTPMVQQNVAAPPPPPAPALPQPSSTPSQAQAAPRMKQAARRSQLLAPSFPPPAGAAAAAEAAVGGGVAGGSQPGAFPPLPDGSHRHHVSTEGALPPPYPSWDDGLGASGGPAHPLVCSGPAVSPYAPAHSGRTEQAVSHSAPLVLPVEARPATAVEARPASAPVYIDLDSPSSTEGAPAATDNPAVMNDWLSDYVQ
eukprot:jgi/Mesen1/429/ME000100S10660